MGAPTKYKPEWNDIVIECGKQGMGYYEMARECDVTYKTLKKHEAEQPDLLHSIKKGLNHSRAWWEQLGREGASGKDINPTVWIFNMKNRFKADWRDKQEVEQSGTISVVRLKPRYKTKDK